MRKALLASLIAAGFTTPAFAATGIAPDASTLVIFVAGAAMIGLAASGKKVATRSVIA